jgi:serine/threonine protein phosphatase PrpC
MVVREPNGEGRARIPVAWASTRGAVREENQDRILVARASNDLAIVVLADGMGGMKEGARAASVAACAMVAHCVAFSSLPVERLLADALLFANEQVFAALGGAGGAALVASAWFVGHGAGRPRYVAHVGDARAYHVDADGALRQVTIDDTVNGVWQGQGRPLPHGSPLHSQLLQFIGMGKELEPHVTPAPDTGRGLLLTSDGIHRLPREMLAWIVRWATQLQVVPERLVELSEWSGGHDNGTAASIGFQNGQEPAPRMGLDEFWMPGGHVFRPADPASPLSMASGQPSKGRKSRPAKQAPTRQAKARAANERKPAERDRQLPLVKFADVAPVESEVETRVAKSDGSLDSNQPSTIERPPAPDAKR